MDKERLTFVDFLVKMLKPYADRPQLREEVEEAISRLRPTYIVKDETCPT